MLRLRILLAAAVIYGSAGSASALPVDFSNTTDRQIFLKLPTDGTTLDFEVPLAFSGSTATATLSSAQWTPIVTFVAMSTGLRNVRNVTAYPFTFDLSDPTIELLSGSYRFEATAVSGTIMLPIMFTSTLDTVIDRLGRKSGLILGAVATDQLLCNPTTETCLEVVDSMDYDPATGEFLGVGSLVGMTAFGNFSLFQSSTWILEEIPEPASLALATVSILSLVLLRRRVR